MLDTNIVIHALKRRASVEQGGMPIGVNDLHIVAHAWPEGMVLVTNNQKAFKRILGLRLENWI